MCVCVCFYPFDVAPLCCRAGQAQADHVHQEPWNTQQVHGVPDERRGDDVVHEERSVVREKDAPAEEATRWVKAGTKIHIEVGLG